MSSDDNQIQNNEEFHILKAHADALERQLQEVEARASDRIRKSELQAEALRAGIVDLDGLRLLDPELASGRSSVESLAPSEVIARLRKEKPWLFGQSNSSSTAVPPPSTPARRRMAADMNVDEWRAARAELIRRR